MADKGKIHVFTGEGKGKTTSALGFAWQEIGRGRKVFMVQFLKAPDSSGEHFAVHAFAPLLTIKPMGRRGFIRRSGPDPLDRDLAEQALKEARSAMVRGEYDVVILDEVNVAVHLGLIRIEHLLELIDMRPANIDLVLTGRSAPDELIQKADVVLEMKKIKHHFDDGIAAREGIEY